MCVYINLHSSPVRHRPPRREHPASTELSAGAHSSRCDEKKLVHVLCSLKHLLVNLIEPA